MAEQMMNLTEIGVFFGVSRVVAGRFLVNVRLRGRDGQPTRMALDGGFCAKAYDEFRNVWFYVWHPKTIGFIKECLQDPAAFACNRRKEAEAERGVTTMME